MTEQDNQAKLYRSVARSLREAGHGDVTPEMVEDYVAADPALELVRAADAYIEHLKAHRHGDCRVLVGPGHYVCGIKLDYEEARAAMQTQEVASNDA